MTGADSEREELATLVRELGVVHGRVTLASGREADYYVDLRRVTLHARAAPLVGRLMRELTADCDYAAVGGLTLGADPVAARVLHAAAASGAAAGRRLRRAQGDEGARLARLIEGPTWPGAGCCRRGHLHDRRLRAHRGARRPRRRGDGRRGGDGRGPRHRRPEAIEAEDTPYRALLGLADLGL